MHKYLVFSKMLLRIFSKQRMHMIMQIFSIVYAVILISSLTPLVESLIKLLSKDNEIDEQPQDYYSFNDPYFLQYNGNAANASSFMAFYDEFTLVSDSQTSDNVDAVLEKMRDFMDTIGLAIDYISDN